MKAVLDLFEGDKAVLEVIGSKEKKTVKKSELPKGSGEGTVVDNASGSWQLDIDEAKKRRQKSASLLDILK